ncbi:MAG: glycosyltransferase family 4 protein, partial [Magnetovibrio sp.]|nr:glycosyltransferase family 4 protein [Magnetovibrio sp.]
RLLIQALGFAGHQVELASVFRSYDSGDAVRQVRLKEIGRRLANRLIRRFLARPIKHRPQAWFTYHLYHKAPDWIGPRVCDALSIPYIVAEASFAPKQQSGDWALGHASVQKSIQHANVVVGFNPTDAACLSPLLSPLAHQFTLPPMINTEQYADRKEQRSQRSKWAKAYNLDLNVPWLMTVAMMRKDQKQKSYEVLATALLTIKDQPWHILIAGTGPAEAAIKSVFKGLEGRVTWLGFQDEKALCNLYAVADLFVWPAIKEAYGMVFLEAMASGVPVVSGQSEGVAAIVQHGQSGLLTPQGDADKFAQAVLDMLEHKARRIHMGQQARKNIHATHSLGQAAKSLELILQHVMEEVAA